MIQKSILFLFFLQANYLAANECVQMQLNTSYGSVAPCMQFLEDAEGTLNFEDVKNSGLWRQNNDRHPSFGFTNSVIWGLFYVTNNSVREQEYFLTFEHPRIDSIQIYHEHSDNTVKVTKTGMKLHPLKKPVTTPEQSIILSFPPRSKSRVYMQISSENSLKITPFLLSQEDWHRKLFQETFFPGIYFGAVILVLFYSIFSFINHKEIIYFYYSCYILMLFFLQMGNQGLVSWFLFPGNPCFENRFLGFAGGLGILFFLLILEKYFNIFFQSKRRHYFWKILVFLSLLVAVLPLFKYSLVKFTYPWVFFCSLYFVYVSVIEYKKTNYNRYFFWGLIAAFAGVLTYLLKFVNIFIHVLSKYGIPLGHGLEILILSYALSDRIKALDNLNEMETRENKFLEIRYNEKKILLKDLQLASLQKIIQPGFLFQSLNLLISLIPKDRKKAIDLVYSIANEFRYITKSLYNNNTSLPEELKICRTHLNILNIINNTNHTIKFSRLDDQYPMSPLFLYSLMEATIIKETDQKSSYVFQFNFIPSKTDHSFREIKLIVSGYSGKGCNDSIKLPYSYLYASLEHFYPGKWTIDHFCENNDLVITIELIERKKENPDDLVVH